MSTKKAVKMAAKKKLILHIGRHKTGTTSLQQFFAQKTSLLAERGILYPETGRRTPHGTIDTAHHNFSHILHYKPVAEVEALFEDLAKEAEGFDTILLSSEDFQNQKDFTRLEEVFAPYDLTVVCYMREGLGYGLSGFAQRIHFSEEIFNIRQYMQRQNIRIANFVKNWSRLADNVVFRLYERDKLKNRDIVEDFLDIIDLNGVADTKVVIDSNPSLSGNLLGLKMLLNLMGQSMIASYETFSAAARLDPSFTGKIHISDRVAEELRALDDYNAILKTMFPDMGEPSFEKGEKIFDLSRWDADMDLISTMPELEFAKTLRLGAIGKVLEGHGLSNDLAEMDFLTPEMIERIRLPDNEQIKQIRHRAVTAANDATIARKARADAERAAAAAKEEARLAQESRAEMSEKLKTRTRKLEKDLADVVAKGEALRTEREESLRTFNTKIEKLTAERDSISGKLKSADEKAKADIKGFKAQLKTVVGERDTARAELKTQAEKSQAEAKSVLETFNAKIEKLTAERDAISAKLKAADEKAQLNAKGFKAQLEKVAGERDAAREELNAQRQKGQSEAKAALKTFNTKLATVMKDRDTLTAKLKDAGQKSAQDVQALKTRADKAIADRDAARAALTAKDTQLAKQAAQVYYFRAELLRLKGERSQAKEMYAKAAELDPDNRSYAERLAEA